MYEVQMSKHSVPSKWRISLHPQRDRLALFAKDHWSVKLAAFSLDTLLLMVKYAGWLVLGLAMLAWKFWP